MSPKFKAGLILTPGAGADRNQAALVAIDERLSSEGIAVERVDFPYRIAGRKAPDKPTVLITAVNEAAAALAKKTGLPPDRIALGGRSMGGRMCSMAVAEGLPALGLLLVSYPLHPPGKSDQLRTAHFPDLHVPCVFISGTRDSFAAPDELETHTKAISGPVTLHFLDGGDHGLRRRDADVAELAAKSFQIFL